MPKSRGNSCVRWCFTSYYNGDSEEPIEPGHPEWCKFICYQLERCPDTSRLHYQGYLECQPKLRLSQLKSKGSLWNQAHFEKAHGSQESCIAYCSKESTRVGEFTQHGIRTESGKSHQLSEAIARLQEGAQLESIHAEYPGIFIRYSKAIRDFIQQRDAFKYSELLCPVDADLRSWQFNLTTILGTEPHPRRIIWYYDPKGSAGKSTMVKWCLKKYQDLCVLVTTSSYKRVVFSMPSRPHVVIIDIPRAYPIKDFNYSTLETLKDGVAFDSMYNPRTKLFKIPHVVVFSNDLPDQKKFTSDRLQIFHLSVIPFPIFVDVDRVF